MALDTYADLQASIRDWMDIDAQQVQLTNVIPDLIRMAESWMSRHLHTRDMECRISTPLVPDGVANEDRGVYDLPSDWAGHKTVERVGTNLVILYWRKIPNLSDTVTTNWLLTKYPDLYLYASLSAAEGWLKDDPRIPLWSNAAQVALEEVQAHDIHDRYSGGPLKMRMDDDRFWRANTRGGNGRLEYMPPFNFFDLAERDVWQDPGQAGYFTVAESFIRIWPKP